jgi:hypothetical protein
MAAGAGIGKLRPPSWSTVMFKVVPAVVPAPSVTGSKSLVETGTPAWRF